MHSSFSFLPVLTPKTVPLLSFTVCPRLPYAQNKRTNLLGDDCIEYDPNGGSYITDSYPTGSITVGGYIWVTHDS